MRHAPISRMSLALAVVTVCVAAWTAPATGAPTRVGAATARAAAAGELPWPARRFAPCGAFDDARGDWYVFGGRGEGGAAHFADAWRIRVRSPAPRWRRVAASDAPGAPPPLRSCAAAFDAEAGRMLVFGGWNGVTPTNGVWALTPGPAPRWERLCDAASCGTPPSARRAAGAVYDPVGRRLLVFGGLDSAFRNDLWALSLDGPARWTRLLANGPQPPPRASHSLAYDAGRRLVWLVGGTTSGADLADTWVLDPATATWRQVAATGPTPRSGAVLVHDAAADRLVLHGGLDSTANRVLRDTWTLDDLGTTPTWTQARPDSEAPQRRFAGVGAFDSQLRQMLVFGGGLGLTALKDAAALDLRRRERIAWRGLAPRTPLTGRDQAAVGFTRRTGSLFAFGGFGAGTFPGQLDAGVHLAETWRLRDGRWRNVTPLTGANTPLHREAAAVTTDPSGERMYVIGGLEGDDELGDAWVADLSRPGEPRWRQLCSPTSCGAGPAARWGAQAAYDPTGHRVVVFGGRRTDGTSFNDVWTLSLSGSPRWAQLEVAGAPPAARWGAAAGYDPVGRRIVLAAGQTGSDAEPISHNDAWALSLRGRAAWHRLAPLGAAPAPRRSPAYAMRVHGGTSQLVLAGGLDAGTRAHTNDVWSLTVRGGHAAWRQRFASDCGAAAAPACRRSASAAYDPRRGELLMVFGRDAQRFFGDAWAFDLAGRRWRTLAAGGATAAGAARAARAARRARPAAARHRRRDERALPASRATGAARVP